VGWSVDLQIYKFVLDEIVARGFQPRNATLKGPRYENNRWTQR
jgi:hypothetical protein